MLGVACHADAHRLKQTYQVAHVDDFGYIFYCHLLSGKQACAYHLKRLVLGALRFDGA